MSNNALVPSITVVAVAVVLQAGAFVIAPRFAPAPTSAGPDTRVSGFYRPRPGLAIPGLASAIRTAESSPNEGIGTRPSVRPGLAERPDDDGSPPDRDAESPSADIPTQKPGASIRALARVSSQRVPPGGELRYRYLAKNTGERVFHGTLTVSTHTPAGTLRCSSDLGGACLVPGDYSDGSKEPNDEHVNPQAVTKTVRIPPDETEVLFVLRVEVSPTAEKGQVLRNHAHVDGAAKDKPPITIDAPDVRVSGA